MRKQSASEETKRLRQVTLEVAVCALERETAEEKLNELGGV